VRVESLKYKGSPEKLLCFLPRELWIPTTGFRNKYVERTPKEPYRPYRVYFKPHLFIIRNVTPHSPAVALVLIQQKHQVAKKVI
jgi:hypothetical protein